MCDGTACAVQCLFECGIVRGMRDENRRRGGRGSAAEDGGAPMIPDAPVRDRHTGCLLAEALERREHRVNPYRAGNVAVFHHHREAVEARRPRVRRDSSTIATHYEILLGAFAGMERLIAGEFEIRAPCGVVADRGDMESTAVAAMNRGNFGKVARNFETVDDETIGRVQ